MSGIVILRVMEVERIRGLAGRGGGQEGGFTVRNNWGRVWGEREHQESGGRREGEGQEGVVQVSCMHGCGGRERVAKRMIS